MTVSGSTEVIAPSGLECHVEQIGDDFQPGVRSKYQFIFKVLPC